MRKRLFDVVLAVLMMSVASAAWAAAPQFVIGNPYEGVNWITCGQRDSNFHAHTNLSDGSMTPAATIDAYHNFTDTVLALTDHNNVTWPWSAYGRDPAALGMVAIQGNEISNCDNIGSFFTSYASTTSDPDVALAGIQQIGGASIIFHPGRYSRTASWYATRYQTYNSLVGMEVFNQGNRYPNDRQMWDAVLALTMPGRPVWGFADDDEHSLSHVGLNWNVLLLQESQFNVAGVRAAMEQGRFYFSSTAYSAVPITGGVPPVISGITVDNVGHSISISATGYQQIQWFSNGSVIAYGATLDLSTPGIVNYVRAELDGAGGSTYTQPFATPEPATMTLLAIGGFLVALRRKSR